MNRVNTYRTGSWKKIRDVLIPINLLSATVGLMAVCFIPEGERDWYAKTLYTQGMSNLFLLRVVLEYERHVQVKYISWAMFFRTLHMLSIIVLPINIHHILNETIKTINMYCYSPTLISALMLYIIGLCEINDQKYQYQAIPSEESPVNPVEQNQVEQNQAPNNVIVEMNPINQQ